MTSDFPLRYAVDTNFLLRLSQKDAPLHGVAESAVTRLVKQEIGLCFTPQNLGEFWNVATRPVERNGFGLTVLEVDDRLRFIEETLTLIPDNELVAWVWRRLLVQHEVHGAEVHDAHIAASLEVHGIRTLVTFNTGDFKRYSRMNAIHPSQAG